MAREVEEDEPEEEDQDESGDELEGEDLVEDIQAEEEGADEEGVGKKEGNVRGCGARKWEPDEEYSWKDWGEYWTEVRYRRLPDEMAEAEHESYRKAVARGTSKCI